MKTSKFYFTFGLGTVNALKYQIIIARSWNRARELMFENYGEHWAFQYDEEQFQEAVESGKRHGYSMGVPMPDIIYDR